MSEETKDNNQTQSQSSGNSDSTEKGSVAGTGDNGNGTSSGTENEKPFDIKDIPEELRPHVEKYRKQIENAFYKKTQEIAEERRSMEETKKRLAEIEKAIYSENEVEDVSIKDNGMADDEKALRKLIREEAEVIANEKVKPIYDKESNEEIARMQAKYPDFLNYGMEIADIISKTKDLRTGMPTITLERAYKLVKGEKTDINSLIEEAKKKGREEAFKELEVKKGASSMSVKPGSPTSSVSNSEKSWKNALDEAYEKQHSGK